MVPKSAVQSVGSKSVVYVAEGQGRFVQREVTAAEPSGDEIAVSGINPGDMVVTEGAFFLRAEHERTP
jgi:cobalt-zinc-cadmium efflux system membrane fusion protein